MDEEEAGITMFCKVSEDTRRQSSRCYFSHQLWSTRDYYGLNTISPSTVLTNILQNRELQVTVV